ncbi:hypothetical protein EON67_10370 [archaeon]|nr:MAG: hypothetical protein EON67_10370 [archaeon]
MHACPLWKCGMQAAPACVRTGCGVQAPLASAYYHPAAPSNSLSMKSRASAPRIRRAVAVVKAAVRSQ